MNRESRRNQKKPIPIRPDIAAAISEADKKEHADRVNVAMAGTIETAIDSALALAVVAFSEAKTKIEKEHAIKSAAFVVCTLHTAKIVIDGALPAPVQPVIKELFVRSCAAEVRRHDQMLRQTLPDAEKLRMAHMAEILASDWFCPGCEKPYKDGEVVVSDPRCRQANCETALVSTREIRL